MTGRERVRAMAPLAALLALSAALFLFRGGKLSLWRDEAFSVLVADAPWDEFGRVVTETQANMVLYHALLKAWLLIGDGEAAVRSLSAAAAVGAVAATYGFGARLLGRTVGLVAALLLSLNAFLLAYAQEARGYALATFLVALASLLYAHAVERNTGRGWAAYALTMALAFYAHLFAAFVLLAHAATVAALPAGSRKRSAVAVAAAAAGGAPVLLSAVASDAGQIDWIDEPSLGGLFGVYRALAGGIWPVALLYGALAALGLVAMARREPRWKTVLLAAGAALPVLVPFLLSFVKPLLVDRYAIVALPAVAVLVAAGLGTIRRPVLRRAALLVVAAASSAAVANYFVDAEKEEFRAATAHVLANAERGDGIVFYRSTRRVPFEYYLRRHAEPPPDPLYPASAWGQLDLVDDYASERPSIPDLSAALEGRRTVWLFLGRGLRTEARRRTLAEIVALVERGRVLTDERRYRGIALRRYERR